MSKYFSIILILLFTLSCSDSNDDVIDEKITDSEEIKIENALERFYPEAYKKSNLSTCKYQARSFSDFRKRKIKYNDSPIKVIEDKYTENQSKYPGSRYLYNSWIDVNFELLNSIKSKYTETTYYVKHTYKLYYKKNGKLRRVVTVDAILNDKFEFLWEVLIEEEDFPV